MSDIIKPEVVEAKEKQKARDRQHERRRLAHDYLVAALSYPSQGEHHKDAVLRALLLADELIRQTDPEKP